MRIARIPVIYLPVIAIVIAAIGALLMAMIDQAYVRSAYQVWQENETFAAAAVALLAAMVAARPVYMQVRAQSVQAALDLLRRTETDTEAVIDARRRFSEMRRAAVTLAGEINAYAAAKGATAQSLNQAIDLFMAIAPREMRTLAERPTINAADRIKIVTLSCVLGLVQQAMAELFDGESADAVAPGAVEREREFISAKLAGLFGLSSEIAEDLEIQEEAMRARAKELRDAADAL